MNIIELAKEAGFTGCLLPEEADDLIGGVFIDDENWIKPLKRFAALVRAEELEAVYEEFYLCITSDLEHGVKSINERAADKFKKEYPQLYKFWEWLNIRIGEYEGDEE